jgi:LmbE family N-acetylglucosaminyl deacetylase
MAFHGILECFHSADKWFGGVTCTNGAGSARTGPYAAYTDEQMQEVRREEQRIAARIGRYGAMVQLDFPSRVVKDPSDRSLAADLGKILTMARPDVVYTHNPADKHETHIAVLVPLLQALRAMPPGERPARLLGCEVWRDLDWMPDDRKVALDVSGNEPLASALNGVFDSQIEGGKRYDLAIMGRRRANATFFASHATDESGMLSFAMDLTPLLEDDTKDLTDFVLSQIDAFREDVRRKLESRQGCG